MEWCYCNHDPLGSCVYARRGKCFSLINLSPRVIAADFGPGKNLRMVQREIAAKLPVWLLALVYDRHSRSVNLA